jgi:hypothetical protein
VAEAKRTDVERKVNRPVLPNMLQRHLNNLSNTVAIDVVHREALDVVLPQDLPLALVNVAKTNVDETVRGEDGFDPAEFGELFLAATGKTEEEGDGAAVEVAGGGREGGVDVL